MIFKRIINVPRFIALFNKLSCVLFLAAVMSMASGCQSAQLETGRANPEDRVSSSEVDHTSQDIKINATGEHAYAILQKIEEDFPLREAGTEAEAEMGEWLKAELEAIGYATERQAFNYTLENGDQEASQNIIGVIHPNSPTRVILGAHYDSVREGHGMDDNGSGVAAVLAIAKALAEGETTQRIEVVFFGAEEVGIEGSEAYAEQYVGASESEAVGPAAWPSLMINFDSLIAGDQCYVYAGVTDDLNRSRILQLAEDLKLPLTTQAEKKSGFDYGTTVDASDHFPFKKREIPILYFEATNWGIGQFDGYEQTSNEQVKGRRIWHTSQDNLAFIEGVFGERPIQHLSLFTDVTLRFLQTFEGK